MVINFSSIFLIGGGGILAHCSWKVNCLMVGFFGVTHHLLSYRPSYEYIDGVICQAKLLMGEAKKATQLSEAIDKLKELENLRKKTNSFSCLASQMLGIYCKTYLDVNKKFKVEKSSFEEAVNKEWLSRLETQFNLTLNKKKVYHFCLNLIKFL
ncbi:MAG: hypothetical protein KDK60_00160 [Chlamydiia bacterium]|nr:hypothetical protein [Chlamydiia bacterium]